MSESNAFAPDVSDMGKHLFFVILGAVILIIVLIAIHFFVFKKHKKLAVVKHSYETGMVSDTQPHKPVENSVLDFPQDELRYSFTFFLEISDFYSNRGYWKCIMIKGDSFPISKKATLCVDSLPDTKRETLLTNCFQNETPPVCDSFRSEAEKKDCDTLVRKLKSKIVLDMENPVEGMNERLDVICRSLQLGEKGKEILCKSASQCGLFEKNGKKYIIRDGICQRFLDRHKEYCDNVYAIDKKVERLQDEDRIRSMTQNHDLAVEDATSVQDYIDAKDRIEVEKRFDDYDNIYNLQHFLTEFQELLPKNLEELNENDLINLTEGHQLNQPHSVRNPLHLEGNYNFEAGKKLYDNKVPFSGNTNAFPVDDDKISEINTEAEEKGYQYFGIQLIDDSGTNTFKAYFYSEEDVKKALEKGNKNLKETFYDADKRVSTTPMQIFITKVKKPGETITKDCWKDVIESYPNQNPGVWLHPFVNDIRIVFTTNSEKPYQYFLARSPHATSTNHNNYHVSQRGLGVRSATVTFGKTQRNYFSLANSEGLKLNVGDKVYFFHNNGSKIFRTIKTAEKHNISPDTYMAYTVTTPFPFVNRKYSVKPEVYISDDTKQQHFYREFFDIKNIPIKEDFHLAIVVNEKIVEVYINGGLTTTQQLFGNPNYNNGKLHISPQELDGANKKIKLGGIVRGFKYFPRTINFNNIKTLIENKKFRQTIGGEPDLIAAEHKHNLSLSHEHEYDQVEDRDHKHSVSEEDISKSFYSN